MVWGSVRTPIANTCVVARSCFRPSGASGLVGAAGAAPPCALGPASVPGAPPVRSVAQPCGRDDLSLSQAEELRKSASIHVRCLALVAARGRLIWMQNPTSSLLWLDPQVMAWCLTHTPTFAFVAAYVPLHKAWTFASNHRSISSVASVGPRPLAFILLCLAPGPPTVPC